MLLALTIPRMGLLLFRLAGPGGATPWWGFGGEAPNSKLLVVPLGTPFFGNHAFFFRARVLLSFVYLLHRLRAFRALLAIFL